MRYTGALQLIQYCRATGLQLWIFSSQTPQDYLYYAEDPGIDVVFSDDAPLVLRHVQEGPGRTST